jgi:hypothetical protein
MFKSSRFLKWIKSRSVWTAGETDMDYKNKSSLAVDPLKFTAKVTEKIFQALCIT